MLQLRVVKIMCGAKKDLAGQSYRACKNVWLKPMVIHCIIHQEFTEVIHWGKYLNLSCDIKPIVLIVIFTCSVSLTIVSPMKFSQK